MSSFTTPLIISPIDDTDWRLLESFSFYVGDKDNPESIISCPEGFITDLASTPKLLHWLLPPWHPDYGKAAVIHDFLYKGNYMWNYKTGFYYPTKAEADLIFLEAMEVLKAPKFKRNIMYLGVKHGGVGYWG